MSAKTNRILATVLMAIPTIVLIIGGTLKVIGKEPETVVQFLTNSGFGDYLAFLGLTELVIAALIIFPKTNKIGFLLATGYFDGAFCLELSGSQPPASVMFLGILWVAMFIKDRQMFLA